MQKLVLESMSLPLYSSSRVEASCWDDADVEDHGRFHDGRQGSHPDIVEKDGNARLEGWKCEIRTRRRYMPENARAELEADEDKAREAIGMAELKA
jgi:hypothetical protein